MKIISILPVKDKLYFTNKINQWCKLPYPRHPKGCPNYDKNDRCPPRAKPLDKIFDLKMDHYFIIYKYNLKEHMENMKKNNPKLTHNQQKCVLYWQGKVRKEMKLVFKLLLQSDSKLIYNDIPEAHGVNVIKTLRKLNIPIEIKPENYIHKISIIGYPNRYNIHQKYLTDYIKDSWIMDSIGGLNEK